MNFSENIYYSKQHTWLQVQENTGTVGITDFAQSELGEIVFVDFPNVDAHFEQDEVFGSIEALKTVSDLFMPVAGKIIALNTELKNNPILVNNEPFTNGWLIKIDITNPAQIDSLIDASEYQKITTA